MEAKLRVVIVDDEELARALIREYLQPHPDITIIAECENGLQAVQAISDLNPDLVLLDMQMPKLTGLEVLELTNRTTGVIFSTAHDDYAIKAFEHHAIDYLLKPYSQQRFDAALAQARKLLQQAVPQQQSSLAKMLQDPGKKITRLVVRERAQVHMIALDKIDFVEAQDDYITIHADGKTYLKTQSLSELETQLDARQFVRIHRSYLIRHAALKTLERINKDSLQAILHSGQKVPVSRTGYERLKKL